MLAASRPSEEAVKLIKSDDEHKKGMEEKLVLLEKDSGQNRETLERLGSRLDKDRDAFSRNATLWKTSVEKQYKVRLAWLALGFADTGAVHRRYPHRSKPWVRLFKRLVEITSHRWPRWLPRSPRSSQALRKLWKRRRLCSESSARCRQSCFISLSYESALRSTSATSPPAEPVLSQARGMRPNPIPGRGFPLFKHHVHRQRRGRDTLKLTRATLAMASASQQRLAAMQMRLLYIYVGGWKSSLSRCQDDHCNGSGAGGRERRVACGASYK